MLLCYLPQLCLVGSRHFNTFGSHGSDAFVDFGHYHTLEQCIQHLKTQEGCNIVGVEIVEGAQPIHAHPFSGKQCSPRAAGLGLCCQLHRLLQGHNNNSCMQASKRQLSCDMTWHCQQP